ncbi:MAG: polysaccharide biosynthesis protein [Clostridiaceae bacterium]|nr:polysaccharide biosynthesis protein [Clostridiaceae bacterium]
MSRRSLKYNAAILTATGFIVKAIGFAYRVFIANSIGTEGLGLYQLMTPIYSLLVLVLSAGISVAVSRFVAEESAKGLRHAGNKIVSISSGLVLGAGIIICGILLLNLDTLVLGTTGDIRTKDSLFWILILVPPIAAASAYKGYFYGRQEMLPNSIGQVFEQIVKLVFVLIFYGSFKGKGIDSMCLLAVLAMLVGECANVLVVYIAFLFTKSKSDRNYRNEGEKTFTAVKKICRASMPISANRLVLSTIGTVESLLIPQRLMHYGLNFQESLKAFGRLTGMASPLVFFPSMLPMALATALVPAIANAVAARKYNVANRQIAQSIKLTIIMGLVFTSFFASCSQELAELVYPGQNVGGILHLLAYTGVFLYLQHTMLGILNGLAKERSMLINTLAGSIVRLVAIWFFMPIGGVSAYIYAVIIGSIITITLNFVTISKLTGISIDIGDWVMKPLSAALIGSILALFLKQISVFAGLSQRLTLLLAVCITIASIIIVFLLMGIIKGEDLKRWTGKGNIINSSSSQARVIREDGC